MNKSIIAAFLLSSAIAAPHVFAQSPSSVAPDNSKSNQVDPSNAGNADTAQTNNAADIVDVRSQHQNRDGKRQCEAGSPASHCAIFNLSYGAGTAPNFLQKYANLATAFVLHGHYP
jgi:hypothetical protein